MPVTLRDIAKHVNLSHATVSFVLNDRGDVAIPETTRNRILEAAKELGYQPNRAARALARGKTQMVALWIPSSYNPFYAQVLYYMQSCVRRSQYDMIYYQTYFGTDDLDDKLRSLSWPVDAILAIDSMYLLETLANAPELADRPIVSIGAYSHLSRDSVSIDLGAGVRGDGSFDCDRPKADRVYPTLQSSRYRRPSKSRVFSEVEGGWIEARDH